MKKIELVNIKELTKISNRIGDTLCSLRELEPYIEFKDRFKYKLTYNYLEYLFNKIDKVIINITDPSERNTRS
jgi:hypothetical protein